MAGAALAGVLAAGQIAPAVFAEETALTVSETEVETEQAEEAEEEKSYTQLETTNASDAVVTAIDVSDVVEAVMPSIVTVTEKSVEEIEDYFGQSQSI